MPLALLEMINAVHDVSYNCGVVEDSDVFDDSIYSLRDILKYDLDKFFNDSIYNVI